ncbi:MAG: TonB-dependent receptor [Flammeovirgaceae bacterium]|nr:TonB-dependent receptor [Flammeovirgaceae bacterium]
MKKIFLKSYLTLAFMALASFAFAQDRVVSGTVRDESGSPMPGVNVMVSGTTTGTVSDTSGKYTLSVGSGTKLLFSFIGYLSQEVEVGSSTVVDVGMKVDVTELSEIVVTGYASQEKKDLTGSVGTVKMADLVQVPSSNVTNQLQGRVAGVTVSGDGRPGQPAKVRIRGFGSFQNNDPLYIVDGVPTQDISTINPNDVESMSVLKDAGAASIYGSRASNGVIIMTTKKGTNSGIKVGYDAYWGQQDPGKKPEYLLNAQEYADLQWLVYKNDGTDETHPFYGQSTNPNPTLPTWADDTDWWGKITRKAIIQNHDLSLSGGNENAKFFAGVNYFKQDGIVITNFSERVSARVNSEFKIKNIVTIGQNLTISGRSGNGVDGNGSEGSPLSRVHQNQPIIPAIITEDIQGTSRLFVPGEYGGTGIAPRLGTGPNTYADLIRGSDDRDQDVRVLGSMFIDVKITDYLNFRSTFGGTFKNRYRTDWAGKTYERSENVATSAYTEQAYFESDWVWTNSLTFNKTFGDHKILGVLGYESVKYGIGRNVSASRANYFSDAFSFRTVSNGAQVTGANSGYNTPTTLASMFLRADYGFKDKYLLSATVRRDGSSRFGADERFGTFPSVSAGWRISEEGFLAGVEFLSDLKIRGGYGTMGNQLAISPVNQFYLYGGAIGDANYAINGSTSSSSQGFRPTRIGNPDAKWETNVTTNIGFDAGLFDNKLQVTIDWYSKLTQDLLYNPALPGTSGAASQPFINIAEMKNTGIDLQLGYRKIVSSDLSFDATLTLTSYNNEILKIADGIDFFSAGGSRIGSFSRNAVGRSVSEFYGFNVIGLFQSDADVSSSPVQDGAEPGFFKYQDLNGDNQITPDDRSYIGNPNPDFTYGLNLGATYKSFDVSLFFYGSQGNEIFNYNKWWLDFWPSFQNQKSKNALYNSWTPERTSASTPKASNKSNFSNNTQSTSYYVEDGSFFRLKNLQIGYTLPSNVIGKVGLTRARVYVQGLNLFTISGYDGLDPDLNTNDDTFFGVDEGAYPLVKQYVIGLNIGF